MLTTLFQEWLWEFDLEVSRKHRGQSVLLLLDNCSSHKIEGLDLQNVDICFLPANTTSKIQPMDAGIIMAFKRNYRQLHIRWMLEQVESGKRVQDLKMDILQGARYIIQSWNEVTTQTIHNCWCYTKILPISDDLNIEGTEEDNEETNESLLEELSEALEGLNFSNRMQIEEFLTIPEEDVVYEIPKEDQIITELVETFKKRSDEETSENPDEADDSAEIAIISPSAALKSLKNTCTFLLQQEGASEYIRLVGIIEKFINIKKIKLMKQSTIEQYFGHDEMEED